MAKTMHARIRGMLVAAVVAVVMGVAGAGSAAAAPAAAPVHSVSAPSIQALESAYRASASPQDFALAVSSYGSLVKGAQVGPLVLAHRAVAGASMAGISSADAALRVCVSIPKWAVVAYAWYVIVAGGATAIVGGFVDATIVGIPAGAVLNAIGIGVGISGTALLYWTDHTGWPKRICVGR